MVKSNCGWESVSEVQGTAQDLHPQAHSVWHFSDKSGQHQPASFKSLVPLLNSEGLEIFAILEISSPVTLL